MDSIRVVVVDDYEMVRFGIGVMLNNADDITLVTQIDTGEKALEYLKENAIDVILMDIMLKGISGIEAMERIHRLNKDIRMIAVSSHCTVETVRSAVDAGAVGYMIKDASGGEMVEAIRKVYNGGTAFSPEAMQTLMKAATSAPVHHFELTSREYEVLGLLAQGLTNNEIGDSLHISLSTAKFHVSRILSKLGVNSRTEAVAVAIQKNLLSS